MTARVLDGRSLAKQLRAEIAEKLAGYRSRGLRPPRLDVIMLGDNAASEIYVARKTQACAEVGIESHLWRPASACSLLSVLDDLNNNPAVDAILVQLPLPGVDVRLIFDRINPKKDVDVFHPVNVGLLVQGRCPFQPCTPHGIQILLQHYGVRIAGRNVVVINRSDIVGKPLSSMLIQDNDQYANATVTVCHDCTPTESLFRHVMWADIVVVAVGSPGFLTQNMVRNHQVIIDVGITRVDGRVLGDCDPGVWDVAAWVTPVPGGVGPLTVWGLLDNAVKAYEHTISDAHICTHEDIGNHCSGSLASSDRKIVTS